MNGRQLQVYLTANGKVPFDEWLAKLRNPEAHRQISGRLRRVAKGLMGDCKSVGDGVLELRIHDGPGYRVYFALVGEVLVLLLLGGDKGTQDRDIAKAKEYLRDYRERTQ